MALWQHVARGHGGDVFALLEELDLSLTHVKALQRLSECGCTVPVKELSEMTGLSLPGASRTADALLRRGLLERREDEHDRRIKRVGITPAGRQVVERIQRTRLASSRRYRRQRSGGGRGARRLRLRAQHRPAAERGAGGRRRGAGLGPDRQPARAVARRRGRSDARSPPRQAIPCPTRRTAESGRHGAG
jgi:DNA-binding MarR family transcriptional regulator